MNYEPKYPIIHIYPTVQGQGPRMGEPMTLVRTSSPPQFEEYVYHKTTRPTSYELMSIEKIITICKKFKNRWVFFGGDDPCISDFNPLAFALQEERFSVWLDTTGMFPVDWKLINWLSTGPKPMLPFIPELIQHAHDIRLYYKDDDPGLWVDNYERVLPHVRGDCPIFIAPRVLTQSCVDAVIKFVLSKEGQYPIVRADIPLFRTLPNFDKNFNEGLECPMCHLMDEFQGVKVKSALDQEKVYKDIDDDYGPETAGDK